MSVFTEGFSLHRNVVGGQVISGFCRMFFADVY
jgi:hypothetical protein